MIVDCMLHSYSIRRISTQASVSYFHSKIFRFGRAFCAHVSPFARPQSRVVQPTEGRVSERIKEGRVCDLLY